LLQKNRKDCDLFAERQKGTFELCAKCSNNLCHVIGVSAERTTGKAIIALDSVLIKSSPVVVAIWGRGGAGRPKKHEFCPNQTWTMWTFGSRAVTALQSKLVACQ